MTLNKLDKIYEFWFGPNVNTYSETYKINSKLWFRATNEDDKTISLMFKDIVEELAQNPIMTNAKSALCTLIALDQFTRHIYRGTSEAFKYDSISLIIATEMINKGWINDLSPIEASFVFFALLHQESIQHVTTAINGFHNLSIYAMPNHLKTIKNFKRSAEEHLKILEQFGRYCYRNNALNLVSTPEEIIFLKNNQHRNGYMQSQQTNRRTIKIDKVTNINSKLKILVLHGWRQNGQIFRSKIKKMVKKLADIAELYFVSSPVQYKAEGDALEAIENAYDDMPDFSSQRVWWISSEGNKVYQYYETSINYLKQVNINQGPFDGIMGFAQGGTMAAIMSTVPDFNPQFLILISAYIPRAEAFSFMNVINSLKTPSLHIMGKNDILVVPERSKQLHQIFQSGILIYHEGGHFVPNLWPYDEIINFVIKFTPYEQNSHKIDWNKLIHSTNADNVEEIAKKISAQLIKDFAIGYNIQQIHCIDRFHFDKPKVLCDGLCPSECVDAIIGKRHKINKTYGLSKLIAYELFSNSTSDLVKMSAMFEKSIQILKRMRREEIEKYNTKFNAKKIKINENDPLSYFVINPKPELVEPCTMHELNPLLDFLSCNLPVTEQIAFPKGTITLDGRLDLCKQVVGPKGIGPLLNAMNKATSIKRLLLGNNIVSDSGAEEIAKEMIVSKLDCWYIAGNQFTNKGIYHITEALKYNKYCTSLWLKRNPLGPLSMSHIVNMLKINKTLVVIDLVNCGILDEGLEILLGAFSGDTPNKTLKVLWLDTNGITYRSADTIAKFITNDCILTDLSLSCNRLCDIGIEKIASAIALNSYLERISFASNRIGPDGTKYLCNSLKSHTTINFVNLGFLRSTVAVREMGNFIGNVGAKYLADMLRVNNSIRHIDLLHNNITQEGLNHIISALEENNTLVKLQFTQNKIIHSEPGKEFIKEKLNKNYSLLSNNEKIIVDNMILPWYIRDIYSVYRTK